MTIQITFNRAITSRQARRFAATGIAVAAALFAFSAMPAHASPTYTVTDLGTLGGATSKGFALNASGITVGQADVSSGSHHAFLNNGSTILDLGTLGGTSSAAYGINKSQSVVGASSNSGGFTRAFLYTGTHPVDIGTLGGSFASANAINNAGTIVGRATDSTGTFKAFYYTAGVMHQISTSSNLFGNADAINGPGKVVGSWTVGSGVVDGFVYNIAKNVFTDLKGLTGASYTEAFAINANSTVVGASGASGGSIKAFRWIGGAYKKLPTLGGMQTEALAVNINNQIVGWSDLSNGTQHAFIFHAGVMTDLNTQIDPASNWTLLIAHQINDGGDIVGEGGLSGALHGFLLTPIAGGAADPAVAIDPPTPPDGDLGAILIEDDNTSD